MNDETKPQPRRQRNSRVEALAFKAPQNSKPTLFIASADFHPPTAAAHRYAPEGPLRRWGKTRGPCAFVEGARLGMAEFNKPELSA